MESFVHTMDRAGERGYGWTKWFVHKLHLKLSKPIKVASYIPLPKEVADTKAVLNIQNADDKCFMWCVLVHLHKVNKNPERIKQYQEYMPELHFKGLKFPIQLEAIDQFEEQNRPITLNVYEWNTDDQTCNTDDQTCKLNPLRSHLIHPGTQTRTKPMLICFLLRPKVFPIIL